MSKQIKLEDKVSWATYQKPGQPIVITAQVEVGAMVTVNPGESELQARERAIINLRQGMVEIATGIKLQSPSGLQ